MSEIDIEALVRQCGDAIIALVRGAEEQGVPPDRCVVVVVRPSSTAYESVLAVVRDDGRIDLDAGGFCFGMRTENALHFFGSNDMKDISDMLAAEKPDSSFSLVVLEHRMAFLRTVEIHSKFMPFSKGGSA